MHRDPKGYYTIFRVTPDATTEEIISAYNRRINGIRPGSSNSIIRRELQKAYDTLIDSHGRKIYDRHWCPYYAANFSSYG